MANFLVLLIFSPLILLLFLFINEFFKSESGKEFLEFVFKAIIAIVLIGSLILAITC